MNERTETAVAHCRADCICLACRLLRLEARVAELERDLGGQHRREYRDGADLVAAAEKAATCPRPVR